MKVIVEAVVSSDEKVWDAGVRVARAVSDLAGVREVMVYTPQRVIKSPLEQAESDAGERDWEIGGSMSESGRAKAGSF
jgi:hypothetical protein